MKAFKRFQKLITGPYEWFLVQEAKKGDKEAFGKLYEYYLDPLYRFVFFRVGQKKEVAEDIISDVFLKAWGKLKSFKEGNFRAWLYMIARHTVIDYYRSSSKIHIGVEESIPDGKGNIEDTVIQSLTCQEIVDSMKHLTEDQREVLVLKFVEDMSYRDIAKILEKKEEAIRALQHRGLKELKKFLHYE